MKTNYCVLGDDRCQNQCDCIDNSTYRRWFREASIVRRSVVDPEVDHGQLPGPNDEFVGERPRSIWVTRLVRILVWVVVPLATFLLVYGLT